MQGEALLVGEGAAAFLALLGAVQGRTGHMQRVELQMACQGTSIGEPLVAPGALEGLLGGGGEVFGGLLELLENRKHIKSREVKIMRTTEQVLRAFWAVKCTKHYNPVRT